MNETPEEAQAKCLGYMVMALFWAIGLGVTMALTYQAGKSVILSLVIYLFITMFLVAWATPTGTEE